MSTRTIELITFENDSVLNQKSISLPIGKVSIRQTAILFSGILVTFLVFLTMNNLVISGFVFAVFLGIGLIGTRVMTADQMIKSHLMMLIRGTSLEQKPEYMGNPKKNQQQLTGNEKLNPKQNEQQKNNNGLVNQILSQIKSLYKKEKYNATANIKKESKSLVNKVENNNKKFSASIELTDQNIIHVTSINNYFVKPLQSTEKKKNNYFVDSLLKKLSKKEKPELNIIKNHITISLDGKQIDESNGMVIKSKESLSLVLENNQRYAITITADDDETPEILQD